jgi:DNA ligase-associated metallophosphoesterase
MGKNREISLCGQGMILLPERAVFWKEKRLLIVADPHFGKASIFRSRGIPIPGGTTAGDLKRLTSLIDLLDPRGLLFLGDLIHGRIDDTVAFGKVIDRWRRRHENVQMLLVAGNHDLRSGRLPPQFRFDLKDDEITFDPFVFSHQPKHEGLRYRIAGHLHPAVRLKGRGRMRETLPCFCIGTRSAVLPAFGYFTGNHVIRPRPGNQIYVIAEGEVIKAKGQSSPP